MDNRSGSAGTVEVETEGLIETQDGLGQTWCSMPKRGPHNTIESMSFSQHADRVLTIRLDAMQIAISWHGMAWVEGTLEAAWVLGSQ
jgi:hypothetical protein